MHNVVNNCMASTTLAHMPLSSSPPSTTTTTVAVSVVLSIYVVGFVTVLLAVLRRRQAVQQQLQIQQQQREEAAAHDFASAEAIAGDGEGPNTFFGLSPHSPALHLSGMGHHYKLDAARAARHHFETFRALSGRVPRTHKSDLNSNSSSSSDEDNGVDTNNDRTRSCRIHRAVQGKTTCVTDGTGSTIDDANAMLAGTAKKEVYTLSTTLQRRTKQQKHRNKEQSPASHGFPQQMEWSTRTRLSEVRETARVACTLRLEQPATLPDFSAVHSHEDANASCAAPAATPPASLSSLPSCAVALPASEHASKQQKQQQERQQQQHQRSLTSPTPASFGVSRVTSTESPEEATQVIEDGEDEIRFVDSLEQIYGHALPPFLSPNKRSTPVSSTQAMKTSPMHADRSKRLPAWRETAMDISLAYEADSEGELEDEEEDDEEANKTIRIRSTTQIHVFAGTPTSAATATSAGAEDAVSKSTTDSTSNVAQTALSNSDVVVVNESIDMRAPFAAMQNGAEREERSAKGAESSSCRTHTLVSTAKRQGSGLWSASNYGCRGPSTRLHRRRHDHLHPHLTDTTPGGGAGDASGRDDSERDDIEEEKGNYHRGSGGYLREADLSSGGDSAGTNASLLLAAASPPPVRRHNTSCFTLSSPRGHPHAGNAAQLEYTDDEVTAAAASPLLSVEELMSPLTPAEAMTSRGAHAATARLDADAEKEKQWSTKAEGEEDAVYAAMRDWTLPRTQLAAVPPHSVAGGSAFSLERPLPLTIKTDAAASLSTTKMAIELTESALASLTASPLTASRSLVLTTHHQLQPQPFDSRTTFPETAEEGEEKCESGLHVKETASSDRQAPAHLDSNTNSCSKNDFLAKGFSHHPSCARTQNFDGVCRNNRNGVSFEMHVDGDEDADDEEEAEAGKTCKTNLLPKMHVCSVDGSTRRFVRSHAAAQATARSAATPEFQLLSPSEEAMCDGCDTCASPSMHVSEDLKILFAS